MSELFIPILLSTGRNGRWSEKAAQFVLTEVQKRLPDSILIDVMNYANTFTTRPEDENPKVLEYKELISKSDGLIIVCPEYNHGYPGEFKILFDSAFKEYNKKPVGIVGVSDGPVGGARVVEMLRLVVIATQMVPTRNAVYFTHVDKVFGDNTFDMTDYTKRVSGLLDEVVWYAEALKPAREKLQNAK